MSRAFVKEEEGEAAGDDLPERPISPHPNYVTRRGYAALQARVQALEAAQHELRADDGLAAVQARREVERDLRYYRARLASAQAVTPETRAAVRIGHRVVTRDEAGQERRYGIVGEDEADAAQGLVSWVSPLARALLGHARGDCVRWERPDGALELEILAIEDLPEHD